MFKKSLLMLLSVVSFQGFGASVLSLHGVCQGYDPIAVKKAICSGAHLNELNSSNQTPLIYVCTFSFYAKLALNYAEQLLRAGAQVNYKDNKGNTALHEACQHANNHLVFLLLEYGANPSLKNKRGFTPLHIACKAYCIENVEYLLAFGAQVNARDNQGRTPLHIASEYGNTLLVKLLLRHGADVYAIDSHGYTPADVCCSVPLDNVMNIRSEILTLLKNKK